MILLHTTRIIDKAKLRQDYESHCLAMGLEPEEGGELEWFYENRAEAFDSIMDNFKTLTENNPDSYYLSYNTRGTECGAIWEKLSDAVWSIMVFYGDYDVYLREDGRLLITGYDDYANQHYVVQMLNAEARPLIEEAETLDNNGELNLKLSDDRYCKKLNYHNFN